MTTEQKQMNKIRNIKYKGKTVSFRLIEKGAEFIKARKRYGYLDKCPLCKKGFNSQEEQVVLIISNQVSIPNCILHNDCLQDKTDEYAFRLIAEDYQYANGLNALIFASWFPNNN